MKKFSDFTAYFFKCFEFCHLKYYFMPIFPDEPRDMVVYDVHISSEMGQLRASKRLVHSISQD